MKLAEGVAGSATLSPCGTWRYSLDRWWDDELPAVLWVMLNPSTAATDVDDWTVRRCQAYARAWGYGGIVVVNLFALRATDPKDLRLHPDPVGPQNDMWLRTTAELWHFERAAPIVGAWGNHGAYRNRGLIVTRMLNDLGCTVERLGPATGNGQPHHPRGLAAAVLWERHS